MIMEIDNIQVMYEGQGQRSKVKVTMSKIYFHGFCIVYLTSDLEVEGLSGQGQRSHRSRSKVTVANKGRWAHINIKLLHLCLSLVQGYIVTDKS